MTWPLPFAELPEGSLVITGNLQCPAGYFEEMPISVTMYPTDFIDPPVEITLNPETAYEDLMNGLLANPTVQGWIAKSQADLFRRVTEGPFVEEVENWRELPKGLQSRAFFTEEFDEFNYVDFQTGEFRLDFDQTARLLPGDTLVMVEGVDSMGRTCINMNIYSIQNYAPDVMVDLDAASIAFAQRLVGLGNAATEVLSISGDDRAADIALIDPFFNFITEAYGSGYYEWVWDSASANLRESGNNASIVIVDPAVRTFYLTIISSICNIFESLNSIYWDNHYILFNPNINLQEEYEETYQDIISKFTEFQEAYEIIERGDGVKELTVIINQSSQVVAQFTIISNPSAALVVMGFIGQHEITVNDYNPYVLELLKVFYDEGINWPPAVFG